MRRHTGFTLLELLVALLVTSMLVAAIASAFSTGLRVWDKVQRKSDQNQEAAAILETIAADMRGIWNDPQRTDKFLSYKYSRANTTIGQGVSTGLTNTTRDPDSLYFTSFVPDYEDTRILGFKEITYRFDKAGGVLLRSEKPITSEQEDLAAETTQTLQSVRTVEAAQEEVVAENVVRCDLRFYDGANWLEQWPPPNSMSAEEAKLVARLLPGEPAPTLESALPQSIEISIDVKREGEDKPRLLYSIVPIEFAHP